MKTIVLGKIQAIHRTIEYKNWVQFISKAFTATGDKADFCLEMLGKGHDLVTPANLKDFQKSEVSSCFSNASARGVKEVHRALVFKYLLSK